jgi:hypothetical protein
MILFAKFIRKKSFFYGISTWGISNTLRKISTFTMSLVRLKWQLDLYSLLTILKKIYIQNINLNYSQNFSNRLLMPISPTFHQLFVHEIIKKESISAKVKSRQITNRKDSYNGYFTRKLRSISIVIYIPPPIHLRRVGKLCF